MLSTERRYWLMARLLVLVYHNWLWRLRIGPWRPGRALIMALYAPLWDYLHDRGVIDDDGWPINSPASHEEII